MGNQQGKSAYSQNASGKPKKNVTWKSAEEPQPPGRPMLLSLSDQQPDVLTLKWDRPTSDGGAQVTGFIVEHRRMGSPHWVRSVPQLITTNEVSISGLEPGWKYQFRVIAVNVVGKSEPSELSDLLTVTLQRNAITVPRFNSELPEYMHVVENERVELRVAVMGTPPPEVSWFKDGFEIFSSRRTKIVSDNDSSVLIFHQVALTDDGEIKCTATNRAGHTSTKCKLVVEAPPKIRLPRNYEEGLIVEADEVLRLKVGIAGQPQPDIQWIHEGKILSPKDIRYEIQNSDKNSAVKINSVIRQDRGEYTVKASNKLGDDVASFLVTVTAKPEAPGKVKLKMSVGKSATLTWTPPPDDGGCKIGNYIVEYYRIGWNVWLKASTTRQLTATLNDLIEGSEYKFRVKAENPYGVSEPSAESDILVIPDSKKTNPLLEEPPVPPKRRTLSPLRNVESRGTSPLRPKPELKIFESENLHLEMSYGTPNQVLETPKLEANKTVRRSPSPMIQKPPKKQMVDEETSTEYESSSALQIKSSNISSEEKSPLGIRRNSDRRTSLEKVIQERKASLEKMVQDRKASLEQERIASLERMNSNKVNQDRRASLETATQERKSSLGEKTDSIASNISLALRRSQEPVEHGEIVIPDKIPMDTLKVEKGVSSNDEKQSDFQTSNEFLLVFHSNKPPGSGIEKHDSFELDLEEALSPPRISISTPDLLTAESELLKVFPIRRSVSSTELLYERAMAKFYEAVELEEAGRSRKSSVAPERGISESSQSYPRKRLGSMTEAERLSFEKRSQIRRKSETSQPMKKWGSKDSFEAKPRRSVRQSFYDNKSDIDTSASQAAYELHKKHEEMIMNEKEYGSDYTASTDASMSEDESMERFRNEIRSRSVGTVGTRRTQSTGLDAADLETYHPRDMSAGVFTPYRSPTPDSSAVALTKPVPLPDPNFVPKPILKKISKENLSSKEGKKSRRNSKEDNPGSNPGNGEEKKEKSKGGIKSFFKKKDKGEKAGKIDSKAAEAARIANEKAEQEQKRKTREEEDKIKKEQQKISQEEAKVVVDHYSDLVREVGATKKYHVPLYMNKDELMKVADQTVDDEVEAVKPTLQVVAPPPPQPSPKLSLSERKQMQHVQNTASKLAVTKDQQIKRDDTINDKPDEKITVTEETRGRSKIIKVKRIIKKRVPSRSRSRVHENVGNAVDNQIVAAMSSHMTSVQARSEESKPEVEDRQLVPIKTTDELFEEAQDTIKAAINYIIDLGLFLFACYVYIFKDARFVIPILALIIYRQIGDTIKGMIPNWIKRRFSNSS